MNRPASSRARAKLPIAAVAGLAGLAGLVGLLALFGQRPSADAPADGPDQASGPIVEQGPLVTAFADRVEHEGVAIEVEIMPLGPNRTELMAHEGARFRLAIRDTASGTPLSGIYPAGWMQPRAEGEAAPDANACGKMLERFVSGSIFAEPEVDLNTFMVLVLNDDDSISVVDPRFGFGGSKLLTMIPLGGPGYDWALRSDHAELYVSVPLGGEVSVIETYGYQPVAQIQVGEAAGRLLLQDDQHYLWAAGGEALAAIDVDARSLAATLEIGGGEHDLATSSDSRYVLVTSQATDEVTVVDTRTLAIHGVVGTGDAPLSIDYSSVAGLAFVAERGGGRIALVDPRGPTLVGSMPAEPGLGELRFAPGDRFGFVVNPEHDLLHIFDAASREVIQSGELDPRPNHVAFSTELAYVRHARSDTVYMLHLDELGRADGPLQVVDFPAGQNPLGERDTPAAGIVRAPGENAVLVAHPTDRAIYYYKEGMAAPMGQFSNYNRRARAVLSIDRSLKEVGERGVYETSATLGPPGIYDLLVFTDAPRLIHCFEVEVAPNPERERELGPPVEVEWRAPTPEADAAAVTVAVGDEIELEVRLLDRKTQAPLEQLDDVTFHLSLLSPDNWRGTGHATARGDGRYALAFTPAMPGAYLVQVSSVEGGLTVDDSPFARVFATSEAM